MRADEVNDLEAAAYALRDRTGEASPNAAAVVQTVLEYGS